MGPDCLVNLQGREWPLRLNENIYFVDKKQSKQVKMKSHK